MPTLLFTLILFRVFSRCDLVRSATDAMDFSKDGPYSFTQRSAIFSLPADFKELGSGLSLTLTHPTVPTYKNNSSSSSSSSDQPSACPVLFLYSGFQLRASFYSHIAARAASWGYLVLQYDLPLFKTASAALETKIFSPLLSWLRQQQSPLPTNPTSPIFVAGHSRGGKIAALAFGANAETITAGFLIDPIDASKYAPISPDNPSGASAIAAAGVPVAVVGAGRLSSCNPTDHNYQQFFAAGAAGSWQFKVPGATHTSFEDAGRAVNFVQDALCGFCRVQGGRKEVLELTATPMLAWFWKQGRGGVERNGGEAGDDLLARFYAWEERKEAEGMLQFTVKNEFHDDHSNAVKVSSELDSPKTPADVSTAASK